MGTNGGLRERRGALSAAPSERGHRERGRLSPFYRSVREVAHKLRRRITGDRDAAPARRRAGALASPALGGAVGCAPLRRPPVLYDRPGGSTSPRQCGAVRVLLSRHRRTARAGRHPPSSTATTGRRAGSAADGGKGEGRADDRHLAHQGWFAQPEMAMFNVLHMPEEYRSGKRQLPARRTKLADAVTTVSPNYAQRSRRPTTASDSTRSCANAPCTASQRDRHRRWNRRRMPRCPHGSARRISRARRRASARCSRAQARGVRRPARRRRVAARSAEGPRSARGRRRRAAGLGMQLAVLARATEPRGTLRGARATPPAAGWRSASTATSVSRTGSSRARTRP